MSVIAGSTSVSIASRPAEERTRPLRLYAGIIDNASAGLYTNGSDNGVIDFGPLDALTFTWIHKSNIGAGLTQLQDYTPDDFFDYDSEPSTAETNADAIVSSIEADWIANADKYGFIVTGGVLDQDRNRKLIIFDHEDWWFSHARQMREFGTDYGAADAVQYNGACQYVARRIIEQCEQLLPRCRFGFYHQPTFRTYPARNDVSWVEFENELTDLTISRGLMRESGVIDGHLYCIRTTQVVTGVTQVSETDFSLLMQRNCEDSRRASSVVGTRPFIATMWYSYVGVSELVRQRDIELTLAQAIDKGCAGFAFLGGANAGVATLQSWIDDQIIPALEALKIIPAGVYGV